MSQLPVQGEKRQGGPCRPREPWRSHRRCGLPHGDPGGSHSGRAINDVIFTLALYLFVSLLKLLFKLTIDIIVITVTINSIMIISKIISITILLTIDVSTNRIISIISVGIRMNRIISRSLMTVIVAVIESSNYYSN